MNDLIKIGNVFNKDNINYVVTNIIYHENRCVMLPFNENNVVAVAIENIPEKHLCHCTVESEVNNDCAFCGGEGYFYLRQPLLLDDFKFVADNIREFLIQKFVN